MRYKIVENPIKKILVFTYGTSNNINIYLLIFHLDISLGSFITNDLIFNNNVSISKYAHISMMIYSTLVNMTQDP